MRRLLAAALILFAPTAYALVDPQFAKELSRNAPAADRMASNGVGPLSPLAPNDSEDGQAKNRRVELVRQ